MYLDLGERTELSLRWEISSVKGKNRIMNPQFHQLRAKLISSSLLQLPDYFGANLRHNIVSSTESSISMKRTPVKT